MNNFSEQLLVINHKSTNITESLGNITYVGDPLLRTACLPTSWQLGVAVGQKLAQTLLAYRQITGLGRGLAAPQIGNSEAVFVTYVADKIQIYINPKISKYSNTKNKYKECCISSHHFWCDVERPEAITIEYTDVDNQLITENHSDFMARLLQHEYDHLLGIVNLDKAIPGTIDYCFGDPLQEKLHTVPVKQTSE